MTFSPDSARENRQETTDKIVFRTRDSSEPRVYQRTKQYNDITEEGLLNALDAQFPIYLETVVRRKDAPDSAACAEWWEDTHATYPLSKVIRESVSLEESSQRPLTALELITRLSQWKYFINAHPSIQELDDSDVRYFNTGTPLALWYCRAFQQKETEIPGQGIYVPEGFFTYLLTNVFFRDLGPTPEAVAQTERFCLAIDFQTRLNAMIKVVSLVDLDDSKQRRSIVHHALKAILTITDAEAQERFLEGESPLPEDGTQKTTRQILDACEASLRALLRLAWEDSIQHELGRVVVLGDQDVLEAMRRRLLTPAKSSSSDAPKMSQIIEVVPANNFYFSPGPVRLLTTHDREHLPDRKKRIHSSDARDFLGGIRDGSLFDSAGNKVWRGDLSIADIGNLQGPLYLLSQQDSYHNVPDWIALKVMGNEFDLKPEATTLNCDYVRLRAVGKIVDGRWIENPKRFI